MTCALAGSPKNKRPRQERPTFIEKARRRQIVDAAIDVLSEDGYGAATLSGSLCAGISRRLISFHFEGRDELMAAVFAKAYEEGGAYIGARMAAAQTPTAMLRVYVQSNLDYLHDHRQEVLACVAVRWPGNLAHLPRSLAGLAQSLAQLEGILRQGQLAGEFRDFDVHAMAIAIRNVIDSLPNHIGAELDLDLDHFIAEILTLVSLATMSGPTGFTICRYEGVDLAIVLLRRRSFGPSGDVSSGVRLRGEGLR
ncbi:MAG: TetR/AcrR family transcriptional regulator [Candidatus Dormibacteraceae bacterium]